MPADFCLSPGNMSTSGIPLKMRNTTGASHTSTRQLCPRRRAMLLNLTSPSLSRKSDFQQPLQESTMARIFTRMDFRSKPESASNMLLGQPRETGEPKSKPKCKQRVAEQRSGSLMLQCQRWKPGPGPSPAQSLPPDFSVRIAWCRVLCTKIPSSNIGEGQELSLLASPAPHSQLQPPLHSSLKASKIHEQRVKIATKP